MWLEVNHVEMFNTDCRSWRPGLQISTDDSDGDQRDRAGCSRGFHETSHSWFLWRDRVGDLRGLKSCAVRSSVAVQQRKNRKPSVLQVNIPLPSCIAVTTLQLRYHMILHSANLLLTVLGMTLNSFLVLSMISNSSGTNKGMINIVSGCHSWFSLFGRTRSAVYFVYLVLCKGPLVIGQFCKGWCPTEHGKRFVMVINVW